MKKLGSIFLTAGTPMQINRITDNTLVRAVALTILGLSVPTAMHGQDAPMIRISVPPPNKIMAGGRVEVTIHLNAPAEPSALHVEANDQDITSYFPSGRCYKAPCDITAALNVNVVNPGWNYLYADIQGPNASTDSDSAQFYNDHGYSLTDATTGYAPSFAVHVHATERSGLEVDYAPTAGNTPVYYPNANYPGCGYEQLTLLTLNRNTLAPKSIKCFSRNDNASLNTYLKTLTRNDLVFAAGNKEVPLGKLNLAPIGGTDFASNEAPAAYAYSVIGYGASLPGLAVESYKTSPYEAWNGVEGELINIGSTTPTYGFRSTDAPAFAIRPAAANGTAKITIGYVTSFPIGEGEPPPNFAIPSQFTNVTYNSPSCRVTCQGGLFTAVFDAYTLNFLWSNTYATNSTSSNAEMARMVGDLNFHVPNSSPRIVIIASVGNPFGSATNWYQATITPTQALINAIQNLNVSGSAVKGLISGGSFSMIGIPSALPGANQGNHNITKWYSSTLQTGETGELHGMLQRDNTFRYKPENVAPFSVASSDSNPNASDLLSFAIPVQIGTAPSVAWPEMNTDERRKAYAYASDQMNRKDYYHDDLCRLPKVECEDIRSRYTSNQLNGIITGIDPTTISYPSGNNPDFTADDLTAVTRQLKREKQYLQNTANYSLVLKEINTNATQNIGLSVQNSATSVATSMTDIDRSPGESKLELLPKILNTAASVASIVGVAYPPAAVFSGVLGTFNSIIPIVNGAKTEPDPQVAKLANLLAQNNGRASEYAFQFNTSVQSSTGMYFNDVYSDWFKLQTVGLMTVTPNSGWYYATVGNSLTDFNNDFVAEARISFFEQVVPQYFSEVRLRKVPSPGYPQYDVDRNAARSADIPKDNLNRDYSYNFWPTAEYPKCEDYVFMIIKNKKNTWPTTLGTTLMGPANYSNANGSLGIPREFFYDTSGFLISRDEGYTPNGYCNK